MNDYAKGGILAALASMTTAIPLVDDGVVASEALTIGVAGLAAFAAVFGIRLASEVKKKKADKAAAVDGDESAA